MANITRSPLEIDTIDISVDNIRHLGRDTRFIIAVPGPPYTKHSDEKRRYRNPSCVSGRMLNLPFDSLGHPGAQYGHFSEDD
jgi:hypothetical protein